MSRAFVTVITAEQIEKTTARNLAEALMILGGLQVSDTTGAHRDYSIDFRGIWQHGASEPVDAG